MAIFQFFKMAAVRVRNIGQLSLASCIPPGSPNRVPDSAGGKVGILTTARWQVTSHVWSHRACGFP